jgi:hypothetical protein
MEETNFCILGVANSGMTSSPGLSIVAEVRAEKCRSEVICHNLISSVVGNKIRLKQCFRIRLAKEMKFAYFLLCEKLKHIKVGEILYIC